MQLFMNKFILKVYLALLILLLFVVVFCKILYAYNFQINLLIYFQNIFKSTDLFPKYIFWTSTVIQLRILLKFYNFNWNDYQCKWNIILTKGYNNLKLCQFINMISKTIHKEFILSIIHTQTWLYCCPDLCTILWPGSCEFWQHGGRFFVHRNSPFRTTTWQDDDDDDYDDQCKIEYILLINLHTLKKFEVGLAMIFIVALHLRLLL